MVASMITPSIFVTARGKCQFPRFFLRDKVPEQLTEHIKATNWLVDAYNELRTHLPLLAVVDDNCISNSSIHPDVFQM
jgi:hypothetical protein